jgi:hypothetical protein
VVDYGAHGPDKHRKQGPPAEASHSLEFFSVGVVHRDSAGGSDMGHNQPNNFTRQYHCGRLDRWPAGTLLTRRVVFLACSFSVSCSLHSPVIPTAVEGSLFDFEILLRSFSHFATNSNPSLPSRRSRDEERPPAKSKTQLRSELLERDRPLIAGCRAKKDGPTRQGYPTALGGYRWRYTRSFISSSNLSLLISTFAIAKDRFNPSFI